MGIYKVNVTHDQAIAICSLLPPDAMTAARGATATCFIPVIGDPSRGVLQADAKYQATIAGLLAAPDLISQSLIQYTASVRYARQYGGMTINGMPLLTDATSQSLVTGAVSLCLADPTRANVNFKSPNGFITLPRATMIAIGIALGNFVQACYTAEYNIVAQIHSQIYTSAAQIDQASEWPSNVITTSV